VLIPTMLWAQVILAFSSCENIYYVLILILEDFLTTSGYASSTTMDDTISNDGRCIKRSRDSIHMQTLAEKTPVSWAKVVLEIGNGEVHI